MDAVNREPIPEYTRLYSTGSGTFRLPFPLPTPEQLALARKVFGDWDFEPSAGQTLLDGIIRLRWLLRAFDVALQAIDVASLFGIPRVNPAEEPEFVQLASAVMGLGAAGLVPHPDRTSNRDLWLSLHHHPDLVRGPLRADLGETAQSPLSLAEARFLIERWYREMGVHFNHSRYMGYPAVMRGQAHGCMGRYAQQRIGPRTVAAIVEVAIEASMLVAAFSVDDARALRDAKHRLVRAGRHLNTVVGTRDS